MTLEEWADLPAEDSGELVDGRLEEEEMPSFIHELVVTWFTHVLRSWLAGRGFVGGSGVKLAVSARRGRMPDLLVYLPGSKKPPARGIVRVPPDIAVEIVTPTPRDARRDRIEKLDEYAAFGVRFYWIVDPELRSFEILERGSDGRYVHALGAGEKIVDSIPGCPGLVVDLPALWAEIARLEADESEGVVD
jgi:Uma2 family endonuclease